MAAKDKLLSNFLFFKLLLIIFIWFGIITVKTLPNIFVPNINPTLKNANLGLNILVKPKDVNNNKEKEISIKNEYEHSEFGEIEVKDIPRVKRLSGPHLVKSWTEIPHVTQHEEIDITEMEQFRSSLRDLNTGQKISITPLAFIMRAMVNALEAYPNFNASIDSESGKVTYKKYFHIGVAVDTPHGLMVPKIRDVDQLDIKEISQKLRSVSKLCKELKIDKKHFIKHNLVTEKNVLDYLSNQDVKNISNTEVELQTQYGFTRYAIL